MRYFVHGRIGSSADPVKPINFATRSAFRDSQPTAAKRRLLIAVHWKKRKARRLPVLSDRAMASRRLRSNWCGRSIFTGQTVPQAEHSEDA